MYVPLSKVPWWLQPAAREHNEWVKWCERQRHLDPAVKGLMENAYNVLLHLIRLTAVEQRKYLEEYFQYSIPPGGVGWYVSVLLAMIRDGGKVSHDFDRSEGE